MYSGVFVMSLTNYYHRLLCHSLVRSVILFTNFEGYIAGAVIE